VANDKIDNNLYKLPIDEAAALGKMSRKTRQLQNFHRVVERGLTIKDKKFWQKAQDNFASRARGVIKFL